MDNTINYQVVVDDKMTDVAKQVNDAFSTVAKTVEDVSKAVNKVLGPSKGLTQFMEKLSGATAVARDGMGGLLEAAQKIGHEGALGIMEVRDGLIELASRLDVGKIAMSGLKTLLAEGDAYLQSVGISIKDITAKVNGVIEKATQYGEKAAGMMTQVSDGLKTGSEKLGEWSQALEKAGMGRLAKTLGAIGDAAGKAGAKIGQAGGWLSDFVKENLKGADAGQLLGKAMQGIEKSLGVDFSKSGFIKTFGALKEKLAETKTLSELFSKDNADGPGASIQKILGSLQNRGKAVVEGATSLKDIAQNTWGGMKEKLFGRKSGADKAGDTPEAAGTPDPNLTDKLFTTANGPLSVPMHTTVPVAPAAVSAMPAATAATALPQMDAPAASAPMGTAGDAPAQGGIAMDKFCDTIEIHIASADGKGYEQIENEVIGVLQQVMNNYEA